MTEREYRTAEGISRSQLWKIKESPEKFKYYLDHPEDPTPALIFGQAVHKMVLEPETFYDEFSIMPEIDKRTKEGKAIWEEFLRNGSADKTVIKHADHVKIMEMVAALYSDSMAVKLFNGEHEKPLFWTDELTGELCKVRLDNIIEIWGETIVVDYKTTNDASTESFMRSAINYGYDFQAGMYLEGVKKVLGKDASFVFVAQEKDAPYSINIMAADPGFINHGRDTFRELLGIYHDCKTTGKWWGYLGRDRMINTLTLPSWLASENE